MGKAAKKRAARRGQRAVGKEIRRSGVFVRLAALEAIFYDPRFRARLNERVLALAGTPDDPKDVQQIADLACALARDEFGVDTTDCTLTLTWQPDMGRKLFPEFHPAFGAVQRAQEVVAARARGADAGVGASA